MKAIKTLDLRIERKLIGANTYHLGSMIINHGKPSALFIEIPLTYGYEKQYRQTAINVLIKNKLIEQTSESLIIFCKRNNIVYREFVTDK